MTASLMLTPPVSPPTGRKPIMSASRTPDPHAVQRVASNALQTKHVSVERLEGWVFRAFKLRSSKDFFYVLRCRPSTHLRTLRHEEDRLQTEAGVLSAIRGNADLLAPRLIEYHSTTIPIGSSYLISGPFKGAILSDIEPSLSSQALASIDRSVGQHVRHLSAVCSSSFGPIRPAGGAPGTPSWTRCFAAMLETILRDGEDALISLPYEGIRDQVRKHRASLDQITQPKLVLVEMASDKNIVVDTTCWQVSGLLDFSTAIWGDPFISDCFYKPSVSFVDGFGKLPNRDLDERIRQYLYILYHSLLAVVRHCYRPSEDSNELEARRNLTTALGQLAGITRR